MEKLLKFQKARKDYKMTTAKEGVYAGEMLDTTLVPRTREGVHVGEILTTSRNPRVRRGVYVGEILTTSRNPRVRRGFGLNAIINLESPEIQECQKCQENQENPQIIIEKHHKIVTPRQFPLEYSWTKNLD